MKPLGDPLFRRRDFRKVCDDIIHKINEKIHEIPEEQFIITPESDLIETLYHNNEIEPLEIFKEQQKIIKDSVDIDVSQDRGRGIRDRNRPFNIPGIQLQVVIPFTGAKGLWNCKTRKANTMPPIAVLGNGNVRIVLEESNDRIDDGSKIDAEIQSSIKNIEFYIQNINEEVREFNSALRDEIKNIIKYRRQQIATHDALIKKLNIPLAPRAGEPKFKLPIKRKLPRPLPLPNPKTGIPEWTIRDEDFEHILAVIRHAGRSFEHTPKTYAIHDEEELRDFVLANLNTHYEGLATGETFRKTGKTDIRIEDSSRAAFVAECKIWRGPEELKKAVDQLLGYLIWRDCKGCLIIFNKEAAGFSGIIEKTQGVLKGHEKFVREISGHQQGEARYVLKSAEDENRLITIHVFAFNLFVRPRE